MKYHDLFGIWQLKSVTIILENGEIVYPFGKKPTGTIQYLKDNYMAVHLTGSDEALGKTRAYSGKWSFQNNTVTHNVEISLEPDLRGVTLPRKADLKGDILTYRTVEALGPGHPEVIWKRIP